MSRSLNSGLAQNLSITSLYNHSDVGFFYITLKQTMDSTLLIIIGSIVGIAVGFAIAKFLEKKNVSTLIKNARKEASSILKDAKSCNG